MRISAGDLSVLSFLLLAGHSLSIAKIACFDLKVTPTVNCYGIVGSWQIVDQDNIGVGFDLSLLSFSCGLQVWRPILLARHAVT